MRIVVLCMGLQELFGPSPFPTVPNPPNMGPRMVPQMVMMPNGMMMMVQPGMPMPPQTMQAPGAPPLVMPGMVPMVPGTQYLADRFSAPFMSTPHQSLASESQDVRFTHAVPPRVPGRV